MRARRDERGGETACGRAVGVRDGRFRRCAAQLDEYVRGIASRPVSGDVSSRRILGPAVIPGRGPAGPHLLYARAHDRWCRSRSRSEEGPTLNPKEQSFFHSLIEFFHSL